MAGLSHLRNFVHFRTLEPRMVIAVKEENDGKNALHAICDAECTEKGQLLGDDLP